MSVTFGNPNISQCAAVLFCLFVALLVFFLVPSLAFQMCLRKWLRFKTNTLDDCLFHCSTFLDFPLFLLILHIMVHNTSYFG